MRAINFAREVTVSRQGDPHEIEREMKSIASSVANNFMAMELDNPDLFYGELLTFYIKTLAMYYRASLNTFRNVDSLTTTVSAMILDSVEDTTYVNMSDVVRNELTLKENPIIHTESKADLIKNLGVSGIDESQVNDWYVSIGYEIASRVMRGCNLTNMVLVVMGFRHGESFTVEGRMPNLLVKIYGNNEIVQGKYRW